MLRHACGFKLADQGVDTRALQAYLGHRSINSTTRYAAHTRNPEPQAAPTQLCTRVWTMYWRIALLVLLTTSVPQAKAEPPDEQALRLLNHYRRRR
jgi:hypothetical protein